MDASLTPGEMLRQVMRHWVTGVAVVTSAFGDARHGMTVNSFVSISLEPPLITVTMNHATRTLRLVRQSGIFALTMLSHPQQEIADRFAGREYDTINRFEGLETFSLVTGAPLISGGLAFLDCQVVYQYEMANATLLIGEVKAAYSSARGLQPLVYTNRRYVSLKEGPFE